MPIVYVKVNLGGSGSSVCELSRHLDDTNAMYHGRENIPKTVYSTPTLDEGCAEIQYTLRLNELDKQLPAFFSAPYSFYVMGLSQTMAQALETSGNQQGQIRLQDLRPDWKDRVLFDSKQLTDDLSIGYSCDIRNGSLYTQYVLHKALEDPASGLPGVLEQVARAGRETEIRLVLFASAFGGEGRSHSSFFPPLIRQKSVELILKSKGINQAAATAFDREHLKMSVVWLGGCVRFKKEQDIPLTVAEAMDNLPEQTMQALDIAYLIEGNGCPLQSEQESNGHDQHRHHHVSELEMIKAAEHFYSLDDDDFPDSYGVALNPRAEYAGDAINWTTTKLPWQREIGSRLRFDAIVLGEIGTQLFYEKTTEQGELQLLQRSPEDLYNSSIVVNLYGAGGPFGGKKRGEALQKLVPFEKLEEELLHPMKLLYLREKQFLNAILDVCKSGKDWSDDSRDGYSHTSLFNTEEMERLFNNPGGVSRAEWLLDALTECEEGNPSHSGLTPEKVIAKVKFSERREPRTFEAIMRDLYAQCKI